MMAEGKGTNYVKLALGAGLLAAAVIGVTAFVPRRKLALVTEPLIGLAKLPAAAALTEAGFGVASAIAASAGAADPAAAEPTGVRRSAPV